ncbi:MAG: bacillithiol biosynthesis deacetylase BshB1 [Gemmatimonadetes bacterium]|nr:bacillithiol biosynthesis deacetylase BshB1 [Gemmatimonadota bacterium]
MTEPTLDVLAVVAHGDDAEFLCGGTLIKAADQGYRTGVLDLTRGERATRGCPEVRASEAERASEILGLAVRRNAGLPDAALENSLEIRAVVAHLLRELRPRILIVPWLDGRHPDHRVAAQLAYDAAFLAGLARFQGSAYPPHRPTKLIHALAFREDAVKPTFVVDITNEMERKLQALACYESQLAGKTWAGEVFPAGERALLEQVRAKCAHYGSLIRTAYGEPFWTRETMRVDDVARLEVSTF